MHDAMQRSATNLSFPTTSMHCCQHRKYYGREDITLSMVKPLSAAPASAGNRAKPRYFCFCYLAAPVSMVMPWRRAAAMSLAAGNCHNTAGVFAHRPWRSHICRRLILFSIRCFAALPVASGTMPRRIIAAAISLAASGCPLQHHQHVCTWVWRSHSRQALLLFLLFRRTASGIRDDAQADQGRRHVVGGAGGGDEFQP